MVLWRKSLADITVVHPPHAHASSRSEFRHHFANLRSAAGFRHAGHVDLPYHRSLFFGGMFTAYVIYRNIYHGAFASTSQYMNVPLGGAKYCGSDLQQPDYGFGSARRTDDTAKNSDYLV